VRWARVVIDRETHTPKGTAFVRFADPQTAHEIIEYSRSYEMFLLNKNPRFRSDPRISL
jgi:RNA recognition motif-containing protein